MTSSRIMRTDIEAPRSIVLSSTGKTLTQSFRSKPIFIVGVGRSGTAVLKQALGSHSQIIACDGESPLLGGLGLVARSLEIGPNAAYRARALRIGVAEASESLRRLCFESAMGPHWGIRRVLREVVKARQSPLRIHRWCAKTFPAHDEAEGLEMLYPDVRFIYVFRNGSDVVRSRTRFGAMQQRSFQDHCREWAASVERYAYLLQRERAMPVRQEALTEDPEGVFQNLLKFLGLPFELGPGAFAKTTHVHPLDEPTQVDVPVVDRLQRREPAHESWSTEERETFKALCGDAMHSLGYEIPF